MEILIKDRSDLIILQVYIPSKSVAVNEFKHYIEQLGRKFIIIGDINALLRLLDCTPGVLNLILQGNL